MKLVIILYQILSVSQFVVNCQINMITTNDIEVEKMICLLEEKKKTLTERKAKYSELTTTQYTANQELIRMRKALKNQTTKINNATKKMLLRSM